MRVRVILASVLIGSLALTAAAQQPSKTEAETGAAVRPKSRVIQIDPVITDRKGNYLRDLSPSELHVWEDNKEQTVSGVKRETAAESSETHFVLLFDRMSIGDQTLAREAAAKFIDANASARHQVAVLNHMQGSGVKVVQGFTSDPEKLKTAAKAMEASAISTPNASDPNFTAAYDVRTMLEVLKVLATDLAPLPGRKSIILLAPTVNFQVQARVNPRSVVGGLADGQQPGSGPQIPAAPSVVSYVQPEDLAAAIHVCNRANVSIYVIDVLTNHSSEQNQLAPLAEGTGGFVAENSRDTLEALRRVAEDQRERYVISYASSKSDEDPCHKPRIKADRGSTLVRARSEYCNVNFKDPLFGTAISRNLEAIASGSSAGNMSGQMRTAFFYTAPNTARVHVAAEISTAALHFVKLNGKFHATLNALGVAYLADGGVGARFSEALDFDFETRKQADDFMQRPYAYEAQFLAPAGSYQFKLVFGSGADAFGKLEAPLVIESWDGKHIALSGVALSKESRKLSGGDLSYGLLNVSRVPLQSKDLRFVESATSRYKKTDSAMLYVEVYDPLLREAKPPKIHLQLMVFDPDNKAVKIDSGLLDMTDRTQVGSFVVKIGLKVPIEKLAPGAYTLVLKASDTAGNVTKIRVANFQLE